MEIRLSQQVAAKIALVQAALEYSSPRDVVMLILDARRFGWELKLSGMSQSTTSKSAISKSTISQSHISKPVSSIRLKLDKRHQCWVKDYGTERGISTSAAINLIVSEYLAGLKSIENLPTPQPQKISVSKPEESTNQRKGAELLSSLKR
ncbi:hypothetical protein [Calothrix sp. UHCC 0171]|uniref:hypothetical protein n=1 Tax=Calothrix sp. UHCC 0171 TaxID=3110245 RepID=UPI002B20B99F|nr:hypothetical protein [Calothrix sp. UHCC 0171]MEA5574166.1 hypothetical protein [Calothrix sp. UHCC 0171]